MSQGLFIIYILYSKNFAKILILGFDTLKLSWVGFERSEIQSNYSGSIFFEPK